MTGDTDKSLKIGIEFTSTGQAIPEQAAASIKKLKIDTSDLGEETKRLLGIQGQQGAEMDKLNGDYLPEGLKGWKKYKDHLHEAGVEGLDLHEKLHLLHLTAAGLGGPFEDLARMGRLLFNPLTGGAVAAIAGLMEINRVVEESQQRMETLYVSADKVNGILKEIVAARPTALEDWIKFVDQMAKLKELAPGLQFAQEQINKTMHAFDQNKVNNAFDFQKPGLERKTIVDDISNARTDLAYDQKHAGDEGAAQQKVNDTANTVADLKKQLADLPHAISEAQHNAAMALQQSKDHAGNPWESEAALQYSEQQSRLASTLQQQFDQAKGQYQGAVQAAADAEANLKAIQDNNAAMEKLREQLVELTNKLAVFDDNQRQKAQHDQIQGIIDYGKGSGGSIGEMATAIHLTQEQTVNIATRVQNHQLTLQQALAALQQRQDQIEAQNRSMPYQGR